TSSYGDWSSDVCSSDLSSPAGDEQGLLELEEQVATLVRGRAVDAEPDADAGVEQRSHRGDSRAEPQVRGRAVGDTGAGGAERGEDRKSVVQGKCDVRAA